MVITGVGVAMAVCCGVITDCCGIAMAVCCGVTTACCGIAMATCCGVTTACCGVDMACCGMAILLATTYGSNTCGLATVIAGCGCCKGICSTVVASGFCVAVAACCGMTIAGCDVARDTRFSRFLVGVCAMEDNSLSVVAMASCIIDVNKTTGAGEAEASSDCRQSGIASAEKLCKSMPGMSISK